MPSEVNDLGSSECELLARYWLEEPWGPWRDNVHTAILAREILRASGRFKAPSVETFMLKSPSHNSEQTRKAGQALVDALKAIAGKPTAAVKRRKKKPAPVPVKKGNRSG